MRLLSSPVQALLRDSKDVYCRGKVTTRNWSEVDTFRDVKLWDCTVIYKRGWQKVYRSGQSLFEDPLGGKKLSSQTSMKV